MTYQEAYDKLIKHAAEVDKWKQGMVKQLTQNLRRSELNGKPKDC